MLEKRCCRRVVKYVKMVGGGWNGSGGGCCWCGCGRNDGLDTCGMSACAVLFCWLMPTAFAAVIAVAMAT